MLKSIKIPSNTLSLQYPKWFFSALHQIQSRVSTLEIVLPRKIRIEASGIALVSLLRTELKTLGIQFRCAHPLFVNEPAYPVHREDYSMDYFEGSLKPLFFERFVEIQRKKISEDRAFDLQLLFSELTQNAKDHSGSERYLVLLTRDEVGVFDLGVSIPAKLEQKFDFTSDLEAIEFSLNEGVTTRRLRTGGFGLFYTLEMLKKNAGYLYIASRNAQIRRYLKNKKIDRKTIKPRMPGTLIYCRLGEMRRGK